MNIKSNPVSSFGGGHSGTWALAGRSCASPAQLDLINLTIFAVGQNTRNVQLYAAADGTARLHQVTDQLTGSAGNISPIKKRKYILVFFLLPSTKAIAR